MKHSPKIKLTPLLRSFLKPVFGKKPRPLTKADWEDFKTRFGAKCRRRIPRRRRKIIKKDTGKFPEHFSFDEFLDYHKPNSGAPRYLKELWSQLTLEEQELVKNLNDWSFMFPATFSTKRQYRTACAFRLERFLGRKFHPSKAKTRKIEGKDARFGKLVEGATFRK